MEEIDLREVFNIFWSKRIQILLLVLIFIIIGIIYTLGFKTPMYSSSTTLITTTDITLNSQLVSTYSEVVKSNSVLRSVVANLNIDEEEVRKNVTVTSVKDTELIKITVTNTNPAYATKIANEIAKVFTEKVKDIYKLDNVYVLDEAEVSEEPSNINHQKDVVFFAFIGIGVAIMYVIILSMLDTTIKTAEDIEKEFKLPVLVTIPLCETALQKGKGGRK